MIYLRSIAAGAIASLLSLILLLLGEALAFGIGLARQSGTGSGGLAAVSVAVFSWQVLVVALLGFVLGFRWQFRRARATRP